MGALNRSLRVVQAAPASHFDRSAGCLREIHSERLTGHCFLHPRAKRGGSCPTTDPEITEKLLRCRQVYRQFGVDPDKASDKQAVKFFRRRVLRELKKIKLAWTGLNYSTAPGVLILHPSAPAIAPAQQLQLVE